MKGTKDAPSWAQDYGMNSYSVGIEMVHVGGEGAYPEVQLEALDDLIAYIDAYYGTESTIIDHKAWRSGTRIRRRNLPRLPGKLSASPHPRLGRRRFRPRAFARRSPIPRENRYTEWVQHRNRRRGPIDATLLSSVFEGPAHDRKSRRARPRRQRGRHHRQGGRRLPRRPPRRRRVRLRQQLHGRHRPASPREHGATVRTRAAPGQGQRRALRCSATSTPTTTSWSTATTPIPADAAPALLAPLVADDADMTVGDRLSNGTYGEENDRAFHGLGHGTSCAGSSSAIYGYSRSTTPLTGYRAFNRRLRQDHARALARGLPDRDRDSPSTPSTSAGASPTCPSTTATAPRAAYSKLSTFADGTPGAARHRESLFKDYRPMAFFGWAALLLVVLAAVAAVPVVAEFTEFPWCPISRPA